MKETNIHNKDKMEISIQKKQQKQKTLVGKLQPHNNHKVWEINIETLEVNEAKYQQVSFIIGKSIEGQNKELITTEGFAYVSALKKSTALKKYKNGDNGSRLPETPMLDIKELKF